MWLALDIEKKHVSIEKGLFGIGCLLFNENGQVHQTFRVIIQNDEYDTDTRAFWQKHPEILANLESEGIPFENAMTQFKEFIGKCRENYSHPIGLVSDHPSFDMGHLEAHLAKVYPGEARLMILLNNGWGPTEDIDGMTEVLNKFISPESVREKKRMNTSKSFSNRFRI